MMQRDIYCLLLAGNSEARCSPHTPWLLAPRL
jgi:hypothetical protein